MNRITYILLFVLQSLIVFAQPCNYPLPPANTCQDAPLICDLDGYCSNNEGAVNSGTPNAFCGQVENNHWISFIAGSTSFVLQMTVENCNAGGGLQAQIFHTTNCQNFVAMSNCIDPVTTVATLTAVDLIIGETYHLMIDGKGGDVCDYSIELLSGETLSPAHAEIQAAGPLCEGQTQLLESVGTSINTNLEFSWSTPDGNILTATDTTSIVIDEGGTYKVVIVDAGGCTDSTEVDIPLYPLPLVAILEPDTISCLTDLVVTLQAISDIPDSDFQWSTTDGSITEGAMSATPQVNQPGWYEVVVTAQESGCSNSTNVEVFADADNPIAQVAATGELNCVTPYLVLDGTGSSVGEQFVYEWTTLEGNITNGQNTLMPTVDVAANYILTVQNIENGCEQEAEIEVIHNQAHPTSANISMAQPCYGTESGEIVIDSVIGGTPPYIYDFNTNIFQTSNFRSYLGAGDYHITIQDTVGCEWDTLITLVEQPELIADLGENYQIQLGCEIELNALVNYAHEDIDTLIWTPTLACEGCFEHTLLPLQTTTYHLQVIGENGCTTQEEVTIYVDNEKRIFIPNAFSPNGDGTNDIFFINAGKGVEEILDFKVFNRWGALVATHQNFQPNDPNYGWDGRFNGQKLEAGVYVYFAEVAFINDTKMIFQGSVSLLR